MGRKKVATHSAGEQSDKSGLNAFWRRIWSCRIPNKVKVYCWRLFHDSLPDASNLSRRGIEMDGKCKMCGFNSESSLHVVKNCWWARCIWIGLGLDTQLLDLEMSHPADWLWACFGRLDAHSFSLALVGSWLCWKNRNRVWHDKVSWSIDMAISIGLSMICAREHPCWQSMRQDIIAPEQFFDQGQIELSIMVDGSWDNSSKHAGAGCLAVDSLGVIWWARAAWFSGISCASEAEGIALRLSFWVAKEKGLKRVAFLIDSTDVYKAISVGMGTNLWCESWLREALVFLRAQPGWRIFLVPRESTAQADVLAKKARSLRWRWTRDNCIPLCCCP